MELMEKSAHLPICRKQRDLQYRDGLLLALLSLWLIRRRSIAVLTVSRHLDFDAGGLNIFSFPRTPRPNEPRASGCLTSSSHIFCAI